jgi:arylsulfatase A-like enzyme
MKIWRWLFVLAGALALSTAGGAAEIKSNIIFIYVDNLGYGDLGCYGSKLHRTPHVDRMAAEGMRLTSFYSASGVCTPSRAALMTGCYPRRVNMHVSGSGSPVLKVMDTKGLNPSEVTIAKLLKGCGYTTMCIGKWHLGCQAPFLPTRHGFDQFFGIPYSDDMTPSKNNPNWPPLPLMRQEKVIEAPVDRDYLTKRYTEEAIRFITEHKTRPFFLYLPHAMPGSTARPFASPAFQGKSKNGPYGDSVEELDWSTGEILAALKKLGLDEKTLVVWTSDNGAVRRNPSQGSNAPLKGWGYDTSEGAMRMPCVVRWPGKVPADKVCDELCAMMDWLPTFAKLAGGDPPKDRIIDGHDIRPLLFAEPGAKSRYDEVGFHYYMMDQLQAVRAGPWKLYLPLEKKLMGLRRNQEKFSAALYDVRHDLGETKEVSAEHPDVVARLTALADKARADLGDLGRDGKGQRPAGHFENPKPQTLAAGSGTLALHPDNPHYFLWRGKPTVLITSAEHYGAVLNGDFDYVKYLDTLARDGCNLTRTFTGGAYLEQPGAFKIARNTLAPAPDRFIAPWARSGGKFDLTRWNDAYFARFRDFVAQAGKRGVVVEVNLFCPFYKDDQWRLSPLNIANNVNNLGGITRTNVYTLDKHAGLLAVQERMVRKFVEELRGFDNIYYEICNEPYFGGVTLDWQHRIADVIADAQKDHANRKLISQNIANKTAKVRDPHPAVSIFNFHYTYPPVAVAENFALNRVIGENETGFRGTRDEVYRAEAWDFIFAGGALFNHLDYSFTVGYEDGTFAYPPSQPGGGGVEFRRQLRVLSDFINRFDFVKMKPADNLASASDDVSVRVLAEPGRQYAIYIHNSPAPRWKDKNKLNTGDFQTNMKLEAPAGSYCAEWIEPASGKVLSKESHKHTGGALALPSPRYSQDVALRLVTTARP